MITRLPGWKPDVSLSSSRKPGGHAGDVDAGLVQMHDPREALVEQVVDVGEVTADALLGELEHHLLGTIDEVSRLAGTRLAEPLDLLADAHEPAKRRHLLDDPCVVLGIRRRRHDGGELRDLGRAADALELAALVELVRERDRVDRLALAVESERGPVDRAVRLAIEVGRLEHLGDGADRGCRQQHRAEDRLLGLQVLRRHDRRCDAGGYGHGGSQPVSSGHGKRSPGRKMRPGAGKKEHMFPLYPPHRTTSPQPGSRLSTAKSPLRAESLAGSPQGLWNVTGSGGPWGRRSRAA